MRKRLVLAFGHKRRRGKDLCGELARKHLESLGIACRHDLFARSIKEGIGRGVFGFDDEQLYGELKSVVDPFWGFTPRFAFQKAGTEAMRRGFDENIWVRTLERRVLKEPEVSVVITDLRFTNEVEGIHRLGGLVIRVDRPGDQIPPATTPDEDQHESETALDGYSQWDFIVENTGTLRDLQRKIENLVTLALLDDLNLNPQTTL